MWAAAVFRESTKLAWSIIFEYERTAASTVLPLYLITQGSQCL